MAEEKKETLKEEPVEEPKVETEATPAETGQSEESVEELKERLEKAERDRDNYKEATLKFKKEKTLEPEEYPDWDDASKKFQKQTIELAQKQAEEATMRQVEKTNEKNAIAAFIEKNPRYQDEKEWQGLLKKAAFKSRESVQDIMESLGEADVLYRYKKGEFEKKPKIHMDTSDLTSVGKTTSKSSTEGKTLTAGETNLAKAMKVDLEKLAAEDMSQPATIEIN